MQRLVRRSRPWAEVRAPRRQEFVAVAFAQPTDPRTMGLPCRIGPAADNEQQPARADLDIEFGACTVPNKMSAGGSVGTSSGRIGRCSTEGPVEIYRDARTPT
jgi:hypothetical protein